MTPTPALPRPAAGGSAPKTANRRRQLPARWRSGGPVWLAVVALAVGSGAGLAMATPAAPAARLAGERAATTGPALYQPAPPRDLTSGNLLENPGFEGGFSAREANELVVADYWHPWYDDADRRPEFKDEPYVRLRDDGQPYGFSLRVFHGINVQKFFTSSSVHDAGLYQQAAVTDGSPLRFSVWVHTWSSDCDDPCSSPREPCRFDSTNSHGTYRVRAGIDPTGAVPARLGDQPPDTVVWSQEVVFEAYDGWFLLTAEAMAESDVATVYLRGGPDWPVKHNDSYWDDARLEVVRPTIDMPEQAFLPVGLKRVSGAGARPAAAGAPADPVPPGADLRIEYPVRAFPGQENFLLHECDDLEFESVLLRNYGVVDVPLGGWTLEDLDGNVFHFPELDLEPEGYVRVWTKSGPDTRLGAFTDLYWGRDEPVWDGPSERMPWDAAIIRDDEGTEVARRGYP